MLFSQSNARQKLPAPLAPPLQALPTPPSPADGLPPPSSLPRKPRSRLSRCTTVHGLPSPARSEPASVPYSPTVTVCTTEVPASNRLDFTTPPVSVEVSLRNQAPDPIMAASDADSALDVILSPVSPIPSPFDETDQRPGSQLCQMREGEERAQEKARRWLRQQQSLEHTSPLTTHYHHYKRGSNPPGRHRSFSESFTWPMSGRKHWTSISLLASRAERNVHDLQVMNATEDAFSSVPSSSCQAGTNAKRLSAEFSSEIVPIKDGLANCAKSTRYEERAVTASPSLVLSEASPSEDLLFAVICDQSEAHFVLSQAELERLQYSDLQEQCLQALKGASRGTVISAMGRVFAILSSNEAMGLKLVKTVAAESSCNLVLLDAWSSGISTSMQELLIKRSFRQTSQDQGRVRLLLLEEGQSLPSQISASKSFWNGWSSLPPTIVANKKSVTLVVRSGVAPAIPFHLPSRSMPSSVRCSSHRRLALHLDSSFRLFQSRTPSHSSCASTPTSSQDDQQSDPMPMVELKTSNPGEQARQNALPREPALSSRFSLESSDDKNPREGADERVATSKQVGLHGTRNGTRSICMPGKTALAGQNRSLRLGRPTRAFIKAFPASSKTNRRVSMPVVGRDGKSSLKLVGKNKRESMGLHGKHRILDLQLNKPRGRNAMRMATSFLSRSTNPLPSLMRASISSPPATPSSASISLAEVCSHLPSSSVRNLFRKGSRAGEIIGGGCGDLGPQKAVEPPVLEEGGQPSSSVKRQGWIAAAGSFTSMQEAAFEKEERKVQSFEERGAKSVKMTTASIEELTDKSNEEHFARRRSNSFSRLFRLPFQSSPQEVPLDVFLRKQSYDLGEAGMIRKQLHKMSGRMRGGIPSSSVSIGKEMAQNEQFACVQSRDSQDDCEQKPSSASTINSLYSCSSAEQFNDSPLTRASILDSPADTSPLSHKSFSSQQEVVYAKHFAIKQSTPESHPPRKRVSSHLVTLSAGAEIYRSTSFASSLGWVCSNEDLEPEVRDCVSSLSGRVGDTLPYVEKANILQTATLGSSTPDKHSQPSLRSTLALQQQHGRSRAGSEASRSTFGTATPLSSRRPSFKGKTLARGSSIEPTSSSMSATRTLSRLPSFASSTSSTMPPSARRTSSRRAAQRPGTSQGGHNA